jgi:hypothetical protein
MYIWWIENHTGGGDGDGDADAYLKNACLDQQFSEEICDNFKYEGYYNLFAIW